MPTPCMQEKAANTTMCHSAQNLLISFDISMNTDETRLSANVQEHNAILNTQGDKKMITLIAVLGMSAFLGYAAIRASMDDQHETFA